jgi:hypothetical protein
MTGAVRVAAGVALAGLAIAGSGSGAQAQEKSDIERYKVEQQLHIRYYAVSAFTCLSPAAKAAFDAIIKETEAVNSAILRVDYEDSIAPQNRVVWGPFKRTAAGDAKRAILNEIRQRLIDEATAIDRLPPCGQGFSPVFYRGGMVGIYLIKVDGESKIYERFIRTDDITNFFREVHDPVGVGIHFSYGFTPWNNNWVVAPFVSLDAPNISVNHTFPGGSYLGTTSNVSGTLGIKVGPALAQDVWLYGLAGVSALNETMKINFIPAFSSADATVAGGTVGAGIAWHPVSWQVANLPLSLFAEYQHSWWDEAHFNAPSASPAFNYSFRRQDDLVKFGVNFSLGQGTSPPPAAPSYPVKALPAK